MGERDGKSETTWLWILRNAENCCGENWERMAVVFKSMCLRQFRTASTESIPEAGSETLPPMFSTIGSFPTVASSSRFRLSSSCFERCSFWISSLAAAIIEFLSLCQKREDEQKTPRIGSKTGDFMREGVYLSPDGQQRMQSRVTPLLTLPPRSLPHHMPVRPPSIRLPRSSISAPVPSQQLHHSPVHAPPIAASGLAAHGNGLAPVRRESAVFGVEFSRILEQEGVMLEAVIEEVIHRFLGWGAVTFKLRSQRPYIS